jgi:hypothetical protein
MAEDAPPIPPLCAPPDCAMTPRINGHTSSLDAAHARLRDHATQLATQGATLSHHQDRLARVEAATSDNHRLLTTLQASVSGISSQIVDIAATSHDTHHLVSKHINDNLLETEKTTKRWLKIWGLIGVIAVLLATIHSAITGEPPWALFGGWLG